MRFGTLEGGEQPDVIFGRDGRPVTVEVTAERGWTVGPPASLMYHQYDRGERAGR